MRLNFISFLARATPPPPPLRLPFFAPAITFSTSTFRTTTTSILNAYRSTLLHSAGSRGFLTSARAGGKPQHEPLLPPHWTARKEAKWELKSEMKGRVEKMRVKRKEKIGPFRNTNTNTNTNTTNASIPHPLLAAPPASAPPSSSSSNGGRPAPLLHSPILSYLLGSSDHQRKSYNATIFRNFDEDRDVGRVEVLLSDQLYGTSHAKHPSFSDPDMIPRFGDAHGKTVAYNTLVQHITFRPTGMLTAKEKTRLRTVRRNLRKEAKKKGIKVDEEKAVVMKVEGGGAGSAPAGSSPTGGAGRQGGGGVASGGARSVDTTRDSGSIYLPSNLSSYKPKKVSRAFLGREEWQRIEGIVDRGSSH